MIAHVFFVILLTVICMIIVIRISNHKIHHINFVTSTNTIAVVGNGPLSEKYKDNILQHDTVVMFNHCQHASLLGERCDILFLRQNQDGLHLSSKIDHVRTEPREIIIFGVRHLQILRYMVHSKFSSASVSFEHCYDPRFSNHLQNTSNILMWGNEHIELPACRWGFTTGFLAIAYLLQRYAYIDIFGFNFQTSDVRDGHPRQTEKKHVLSCNRCNLFY